MKLSAFLILWCAVVTGIISPVYSENKNQKTVAGLTTVYHHNSHSDVILSRMLQTYTLDGKGEDPPLKLVSLYTDQKPDHDISRMLAASHRFPIYKTIGQALTLDTNQLAVDGVLLIAEHGDYPMSPTGNRQYPKRRMFDEIISVFKNSQKVVPVFCDKHLADNWKDAKYIYDTSKSMNIPLMAGSSLPVTWRRPAADVNSESKLKEIVAFTFGSTDAYGFHALEFVQALAEQRKGGETGIKSVQCLAGEEFWKAFDQKIFSPQLFQQAWDRLPRHLNNTKPLHETVKQPLMFILEYKDGLKAYILEMNGAVGEWSAAWSYENGQSSSTQFYTQEARPGMHFSYLLHGVEKMVMTGKPTWPVERTLMTSGVLDSLLISRKNSGKKLDTPHLDFSYEAYWRWSQPPPPPPSRPWSEQ